MCEDIKAQRFALKYVMLHLLSMILILISSQERAGSLECKNLLAFVGISYEQQDENETNLDTHRKKNKS